MHFTISRTLGPVPHDREAGEPFLLGRDSESRDLDVLVAAPRELEAVDAGSPNLGVHVVVHVLEADDPSSLDA